MYFFTYLSYFKSSVNISYKTNKIEETDVVKYSNKIYFVTIDYLQDSIFSHIYCHNTIIKEYNKNDLNFCIRCGLVLENLDSLVTDTGRICLFCAKECINNNVIADYKITDTVRNKEIQCIRLARRLI
jgi:hypothetical protein